MLKYSYSVIAPIYDTFVKAPFDAVRKTSWQDLGNIQHQHVLIPGIGSGLDIPYLPDGAIYTGIDLTPAMLNRGKQHAQQQDIAITLEVADAMQLPFDDHTFDIVVMHLILAVVPQPQQALQEASRVLRPGGRIIIVDKFLKPGEKAYFKRALNVLFRHIATRTDVVFEPLLAQQPELSLQHDKPVLAGGWFRRIELLKR